MRHLAASLQYCNSPSCVTTKPASVSRHCQTSPLTPPTLRTSALHGCLRRQHIVRVAIDHKRKCWIQCIMVAVSVTKKSPRPRSMTLWNCYCCCATHGFLFLRKRWKALHVLVPGMPFWSHWSICCQGPQTTLELHWARTTWNTGSRLHTWGLLIMTHHVYHKSKGEYERLYSATGFPQGKVPNWFPLDLQGRKHERNTEFKQSSIFQGLHFPVCKTGWGSLILWFFPSQKSLACLCSFMESLGDW